MCTASAISVYVILDWLMAAHQIWRFHFSIGNQQPIEEEITSDYKSSDFYPVYPADIVGDGKYSIISKLDCGRNSTVWLTKDVQRYVFATSKAVC
jgi:hypothetical protein